MEKYVAYEKMSKKARKAENAKRRNTWGAINPVTRKPDNSRAYNRAKSKRAADIG